MVEQLADMPPGVIGVRMSGKVTGAEYHELVDPVLEALDRGEQVRYLVVTSPDFEGLDLDALWQDVKTAGSVGLKHRKAWERFALVTDKDWMRRAVAAFGWLSPGELRVFDPDQLEDAKAWVAATD
jgi:SpoIIAA-like